MYSYIVRFGQDGIGDKPGEIADKLHMDMIAHRKKTADFNASWKVLPVHNSSIAEFNSSPWVAHR